MLDAAATPVAAADVKLFSDLHLAALWEETWLLRLNPRVNTTSSALTTFSVWGALFVELLASQLILLLLLLIFSSGYEHLRTVAKVQTATFFAAAEASATKTVSTN